MARKPRSDRQGGWFHVMNRGIARRTLFERRQDMTVFLGHLGEACARGEIEVHAFSIMPNHYHLLVRNREGGLGKAMQRVQTEYSRWFNRSRRRDGPLVRGRYAAKEVESIAYRRTVVSYIDRNPVAAGLVASAGDYPFGSAREYEGAVANQYPWLERRWVEGEVVRVLDLSEYSSSRYADLFGNLPDELARVVESRWRSRPAVDPLDDLVRAAPRAVQAWMKRKATLADGVRPGVPVLDPDSVRSAIEIRSRVLPQAWTVERRNGWQVLHVGLVRHLCGLGLVEIGTLLGVSRSSAGTLSQLHARLLQSNAEYSRRAALVAHQALGVWERGIPRQSLSSIRAPRADGRK